MVLGMIIIPFIRSEKFQTNSSFIIDPSATDGLSNQFTVLQETIKRLVRGQPVTTIAFDLGYQSLSAFIEMFSKELGVSPRQYARQRGEG